MDCYKVRWATNFLEGKKMVEAFDKLYDCDEEVLEELLKQELQDAEENQNRGTEQVF